MVFSRSDWPATELSDGVSVGCSLAASVRIGLGQANSETWLKGVDMFWNSGKMGRRGMQGTAFPSESAQKLVKSQELASKTSPAFDAWLQAYRKRLEEACRRPNSLPGSHANANG